MRATGLPKRNIIQDTSKPFLEYLWFILFLDNKRMVILLYSFLRAWLNDYCMPLCWGFSPATKWSQKLSLYSIPEVLFSKFPRVILDIKFKVRRIFLPVKLNFQTWLTNTLRLNCTENNTIIRVTVFVCLTQEILWL